MEKQKKSKKIRKLLLLIYVIFLLSIILNNGLSKYRSTYANKTSAEIAKPIINVVTENELSIDNLHNEEVEWNFTVNNYTDEEINQISLTYKIKIDKGNLTDLQYVLYKIEDDETRTEITMNDNETAEAFELSNVQTQEDKYCLVIKTTDEITQKGLEGNINISVTATQIKE